MKIKIFLLLSLITYIISCKPTPKDEPGCHSFIKICNNSDKDIYVLRSYDYPDTVIANRLAKYHLMNNTEYRIKSNSCRKVFGERNAIRYGCIEANFGGKYPIEALIIYIFDADLVDYSYGEELTQDFMVLKRHDLSLQDLNDMDWTITYP